MRPVTPWIVRIALLLALAIALPLTAQEAQTEVQQIERMLGASPDHGGVWIAMATAHAKAGNKAEALKWLEKAVARGLDIDLPEDPAFAALRETPEMKALIARITANQRTVSRSKVAFRIPDKELIPEGIAHDPESGSFFVGSIYKRKIVRIDKAGKASDFTSSGQDGLWDVLGMRVDPASRTLWVCSAAGAAAGELDGSSSLYRYDLKTAKLLGKYDIPGKPHLCNDIAVGKGGEVFITDSKGGMVHRLKAGGTALETLVASGTFIYPNGITISPDFGKLYVADFTKGVSIVDVATGQVRPLPHPERVHVAGLDGLYLDGKSLVAVQNSAGTARIVRFRLNAALDSIEGEETLESRNPLFKIPTTGVLAYGSLFYIANSHLRALDEQGRLKPDAELREAVILEVPLGKS